MRAQGNLFSRQIMIFFTILIAIVIAITVLERYSGFDFSREEGTPEPHESHGSSSESVIFSESYPQVTERQIVNYMQENAGPRLKYKGYAFYNLGLKYDIDPAFAGAVSMQATSLGRDTCEGISEDCNNFFCINASEGSDSCGAWAKYKTPEEGIEAFYKLIRTSYVDKYGQDTIAEITCAPETGRSTHCYCWEDGYCRSWVQNVPEYTMSIRRYGA